MKAHSDFVHLHVHSQYSLLDGACRLDGLIEQARRHKMPALALTDHGNLFGAIEFYQACMKGGIKPILGVETYVAPNSRFEKSNQGISDASYHLILLARDEQGYRNLIKLVSLGYLEGFYYRPRVDKELLAQYGQGLMALSGCLASEIPHLIVAGQELQARKVAGEFVEIFGQGNFYLELQDHHLSDQAKVNRALVEMAQDLALPLVATNDLHYLDRMDAKAHEALLCIQTGTTLADPHRFRFANDEFYFKSPEEMLKVFHEVPDAVRRTVEIAEKSNIELDLTTPHLPQFTPPAGKTETTYLRELIDEGVTRRYPSAGDPVRQRVQQELSVIEKTGFTSYFLIVWDFVRYAKSQGIPVGPGRGSAAGSVVSYCLGITDIDPLQHDLLFERFLNPDRISFPDIDIDFCYERRPEVISYVQQKYGQRSVAQIITFGTMMAKAVVRDVARVMGFSYPEADRIAKLIPFELGMTLTRALELSPELKGLYESDPKVGELIDTSMKLEGLTRHASTHAAGVVIADGDLTDTIPLFKTSDDQITTGYAMESLEKVGLLKMDFLGLRTLTVVEETVKIVKRTRGVALDWATVPLDDAATYRMLGNAESTGVFQLESSGMRDLLRKLKPDRLADLVALLALFRPGPIGSGMLDDFIKRRHGQVKAAYDHPLLEPILKDTYGICLGGDTLIEDVGTGTRYRLDELPEFPQITVQGVSTENCPVVVPVTRVIANGVKPVYRVTLRNGAAIKMTADHRVLTEAGWTPLRELSAGDYIATPRQLVRQNGDYDPRRLRALAYLIADGDISSRQNVAFISKDPLLIQEFERCTASFELVSTRRLQQVRGVTRVMATRPRDEGVAYHTPSGLLTFLREHGLKGQRSGCRSGEKFVPSFVFALNPTRLATFIAALWDCDGRVGSRLCHYVTTSPLLARDVQTLLLKLSIPSAVYTSRYWAARRGWQTKYQVTVYDGELFGRTIQPLMQSRKRRVVCTVRSDTTVSRRLFFRELETAIGDESRRGLQRRVGLDRQHFNARGRQRSRIKGCVVRPVAEQLELMETLRALRVRWELIVSIEKVGAAPVYDLEVADVHNFIANGIVVHNCVYQEQVMRIAHDVAGFSLGRADILRRAMGKKNPEVIEQARTDFVSGAVANRVDRKIAEKIFETIAYFGGYGFNRSHSAAYAVISYRTAYLKANYPAEFMTALLTSERENLDKIAQYIEESRRMNIQIQPPDVNESFSKFTVVNNTTIRFGLSAVKNVGQGAIDAIIRAREAGGHFASLYDFCERVDLRQVNRKVLESLIKCGAFDSMGLHRSQLVAMLDRALDVASGTQKDKQAGQMSLFGTFNEQAPFKNTLQETPTVREWPESQRLAYEKELLGFYLTGHPLARHERLLKAYCTAPIDQLGTLRDGGDVTLGGVIAKVKVTTTKKGNERMAIVLLEDFSGSVEVLIFPKAYAACAKAIAPEAIVFIRGRVSLREESPKLLANEVISLEEARQSFTQGITITLFTAGLEQSTMEAVYRVLKQHAGSVPVTLVFTTPERQTYTLESGEGCRVAPSDELFADLEALLGQDVVTVRTAPRERLDNPRSVQYAG